MRLRSVVIGATLAAMAACGSDDLQIDTVRITIPRGATLTAVADTLEQRGVVKSSRRFKLYARVSGRQRGIQAGTYDFPSGMPMRAVLETLVSGREALQSMVVPEGLALLEVADRIQEQVGVSADSFLLAARDTAVLARLGIAAPTLEGYLYPSTYHVRIGVTAQEVVVHMVEEFARRWKPGWDSTLSDLGWTRHQLVTLASIIEGEVRYAPDREYVSSVYHNRLDRGMRLQADPTVIYALGRRRRLYQRDYQTPSPYNTYLIDGLPPGPIGQPSAASIEAALHPITTGFLFFVARPDGKHVFTRTHAEHLNAVREVRRLEVELGIR